MQFIPRKLVFKAWNKQTKLLMRLNNIECVKGELYRKDHILLQFTGLYDKQEEEIYEMDIILIGSEKFIVIWDASRNGWCLVAWSNLGFTKPFVKGSSQAAIRICSYIESEMTT